MFDVAIITASDKGSKGEREDLSGTLVREIMGKSGFRVVKQKILPDEQKLLSDAMAEICDKSEAQLILTTGGTGFSPRDVTPEATEDIGERRVPGIAEAMRAYSLTITPRAMLSRATSVIRKTTLIINLPGSPKAVGETLNYILPALTHGLEILTGKASECAGK